MRRQMNFLFMPSRARLRCSFCPAGPRIPPPVIQTPLPLLFTVGAAFCFNGGPSFSLRRHVEQGISKSEVLPSREAIIFRHWEFLAGCSIFKQPSKRCQMPADELFRRDRLRFVTRTDEGIKMMVAGDDVVCARSYASTRRWLREPGGLSPNPAYIIPAMQPF